MIPATFTVRGGPGLPACTGLALALAGLSGELRWVEAVRIDAFCQSCVVSAALMAALAALAARQPLRA